VLFILSHATQLSDRNAYKLLLSIFSVIIQGFFVGELRNSRIFPKKRDDGL